MYYIVRRRYMSIRLFFNLKSRIVKMSAENAEIINAMNHKEILDTNVDKSHDKILAMS